MVRTIGVIGGKGHYGTLFRRLIRRCTLDVDVLVNDKRGTPDGHVYVPLAGLKECSAVIFAVPMDEFEESVKELLAVEGLRGDMVLVNVCSDQQKSGEALARLAGDHPYICFHSPWGPEAYRLVNEVVSELPAIVLTHSTLERSAHDKLISLVRNCGFKVEHTMKAEEHDRKLAGRWMYVAHLFAQILISMNMLDEDCSMAPLSFQYMVKAARLLRNDRSLFFDLWNRVPACHDTFEKFLAAAHALAVEKEVHANGK